ncbi:hypothetical protein GBQ13_24285, partial [Mycobacterium avium subsp. hominissuis]|nr:hypothetical protein [Mycobacterium avium subsp. hominissuis]
TAGSAAQQPAERETSFTVGAQRETNFTLAGEPTVAGGRRPRGASPQISRAGSSSRGCRRRCPAESR